MVILALTFLTPYFSYIPKATLSAVIICAVIFMVEVTIIKMIWKVNSMYLRLKSLKIILLITIKKLLIRCFNVYFFRIRHGALPGNVYIMFNDWNRIRYSYWNFSGGSKAHVFFCKAQSFYKKG